MKRLLCSLLAVCMCSTLLFTMANAADIRSSAYLDSYVCSVTPKSGGKIVVSASVDAVINATEIGATDVYLYESSNGTSYTCVEHFSSDDYPEMLGSGWSYYDDLVTYEGTVGKYYFARVYVYAGNSSGGDTRVYETASRKAIA